MNMETMKKKKGNFEKWRKRECPDVKAMWLGYNLCTGFQYIMVINRQKV